MKDYLLMGLNNKIANVNQISEGLIEVTIENKKKENKVSNL